MLLRNALVARSYDNNCSFWNHRFTSSSDIVCCSFISRRVKCESLYDRTGGTYSDAERGWSRRKLKKDFVLTQKNSRLKRTVKTPTNVYRNCSDIAVSLVIQNCEYLREVSFEYVLLYFTIRSKGLPFPLALNSFRMDFYFWFTCCNH